MVIRSWAELEAWLTSAQENRQMRTIFTIGHPLAAQVNRERIKHHLTLLLPLVQRRSETIRRERNGEWYVNAALHYRDAIRWLERHQPLLKEEQACLEKARTLAAAIRQAHPADEECARALIAVVHAMAPYSNPPRGTQAHRDAVSARAVLAGEGANCQGFSDCYLLLAFLCGLKAACRCGFKGREMHVWNQVYIGGRCFRADATAGEIEEENHAHQG